MIASKVPTIKVGIPVAAKPMITMIASSAGRNAHVGRTHRTSAFASRITTKQKPALVGKYDQVISDERTIQIE